MKNKIAKRIAKPLELDEIEKNQEIEICPCCGYPIVF